MLKGFVFIIAALTLAPAFAQETRAPQPILPDTPSAATPQTGEMAKPAFPPPDKKPVTPPAVVVKAPPQKVAPVQEAPKKGPFKKAPPAKQSIKKKPATKKAR